ncbi:MAG: hypothetical protein SWK76_03525 [Actinomycetota bacterium]|nr:hypothetical protein [Actinomycetota bacterium]
MRVFKSLYAGVVILVLTSLSMFAASFWTGDALAPAINTVQFVLVLLSLVMAFYLFLKLDKSSLGRPIWGLVSIALLIDIVAVFCELINGYARSWRISQETVFLIYLFVWLVLIVIPAALYMLFKRSGFEFKKEAYYSVIPPLAVVTVVAVVVVLVPLLRSDLDIGTKISNFVATLVGLAVLYFVLFVVVTIGEGQLGRPWLFLSFCVASIVIQTIVTTNVIIVLGYMRVLEPGNFFLHLGYGFLLVAEAYQYRILRGL